MSSFRWTCPHCSEIQTVVRQKVSRGLVAFDLGEDTAEGKLGCYSSAFGCSNPECGKTTVRARVQRVELVNLQHGYRLKPNSPPLYDRQIIPEGSAKPQPEYIPQALRDDYYEACMIRDLSPKASATLTRRCLQGMIRDFAGIKKGTLIGEINALKDSVKNGKADRTISAESVQAIDDVRGVGNIGAHMEKDINMIVDVDPGEAQALIELVESLFDEWYGAREKRKNRFARVSQIAGQKKQQIAEMKEAKALPEPAGEGAAKAAPEEG